MDREVKLMVKLYKTLSQFDGPTIKRVLTWLNSKFEEKAVHESYDTAPTCLPPSVMPHQN